MSTVEIKHISPRYFYSLYHSMRLYFMKNYDINKYGYYPKRFMNRFDNDRHKNLFINIAKKIRNEHDAINLLLSNFIDNDKFFISDFRFDCEQIFLLKRYENNKNNIINDFEELNKNTNILELIKNGELANQVILQKKHIVLFSYIDKCIPIMQFAIENDLKNNKPTIIQDLFYGETGDLDTLNYNKFENNLFTKVQNFVIIEPDVKNEIKPIIENILFSNS